MGARIAGLLPRRLRWRGRRAAGFLGLLALSVVLLAWGPLEAEVARPLAVDGWSGTRFRLVRVDGDAQGARVFALFDAKYGPRRLAGPGRARLALRLLPRREVLGGAGEVAPDSSVA